MIDADTGSVLYAYNEHEKMQPASLAKIMTFSSLTRRDEGRQDHSGHRRYYQREGLAPVDGRYRVADVSERLAEGSGERSSLWPDGLLGQRCRSGARGASRRKHRRVHDDDERQGQGNRPQRDSLRQSRRTAANRQFTTAADMVALAHSLVQHHPEAITYTSAKDSLFPKISQPNFNKLLLHDPRVNGIKTGHVDEAGYHLVLDRRPRTA